MLLISIPCNYRRAALRMWKERIGSEATYQKLINIFEQTGYHNYAEIVRNIACHKMDHFEDYAEHLSQPVTYPNPILSPSSPTKHIFSSGCHDEFLQVNPTVAQGLPKGEN